MEVGQFDECDYELEGGLIGYFWVDKGVTGVRFGNGNI